MSRHKQIEEIVKDFCPLYQEYGSCKQCNKGLTIDDEPCYYGCVANLIIDYGYRKASDVALAVIGEVVLKAKAIFCPDCDYDVADIRYALDWLEAELKKKYTEGGKDK